MLDTVDVISGPDLVTYFQRILHSNDMQEVDHVWEHIDITILSQNKSSNFNSNLDYTMCLRIILNEKHVKNIEQLPRILSWFTHVPLDDDQSDLILDNIADFLIANRLQDVVCFVEILQNLIYAMPTPYIKPSSNYLKLCDAFVHVLTWLDMSHGNSNLVDYSTELEKIKNYLDKIISNSNSNEDTNRFIYFTTLCKILLKSDRVEEPSPAAVIVLQTVPDQSWQQYMPNVVDKIICECTEDHKITTMLKFFCCWIVKLPSNYMKYLSMWLTLFIGGLENYNKSRITRDIAEMTLPSIFFKCLKSETFFTIESENNIVLKLLIYVGSTHSYHTIVKLLISFFKANDETNIDSNKKEIMKSIIRIMHKLLIHFQEHLRSCKNCQEILILTEKNCFNSNSYIVEESEEMDVSYPSTSSGIGKYVVDKVGLVNLGNTCYMNSVLQALAMTRQFCHEVLLYKFKNDLNDQSVLKNLQNLFALLKYSKRESLAPTEILCASKPAYFMPGQQQDSSEFLCHLLDVMYEQEKSALMHNSNSDQSITQLKIEDKEMVDAEETTGVSNSPVDDDGTSQNMVRWTTEENLSEKKGALQRTTQSLADFTQEGEELMQIQNALTDSHSDSTDSGIQSVGGEDLSTSSGLSTFSIASPTYLVHRVFGGELKVIYQCTQCGTESHNTDQFRDLQLCFLENLVADQKIKVQDLINSNFSMPEELTGDNKYRCDKCKKLCEAQRIIKILQPPAHLILTLKHFRYDSESRLRTKLRRKVIYDEEIRLPVLERENETYVLYAAVVHSGYSMDYGHYMTYACDANNKWYKFNDSFVGQTTIEAFKRLEPPDTPYILFYKRCSSAPELEDAPKFTLLPKSLRDYVEMDKRKHLEERNKSKLPMAGHAVSRFGNRNTYDRHDDDDSGNSPPTNCRSAVSIPHQQYLY